MSSPNCSRPRVLVTGASGFLGRHLTEVLRREYFVRSLDLTACPQADESVCGSVANTATVDRALDDMNALVIAHMAPNRPEVYGSPEIPFDVNVKGTAMLLAAAVRQGLRRVVLISSVSVVSGAQAAGEFLTDRLPASPGNLYSLTKHLQEETARYHHRCHGLEVAVLRPAYISRGDTLEDKYGVRRPSVNWQFIDPRDIGTAAAAALRLDRLGCEVFYLMAGPGAEAHAEVARTAERLGWQPQYRFGEFAQDKKP